MSIIGGVSDGGDIERWQARQRALATLQHRGAAVLERHDVDDAVILTQELAHLLWSFHDDKALWKALERHHDALDTLQPDQRVRLVAAMAINWEPFLLEAGYRPPPPADELADEFRIDVERALSGAEEIDLHDLRQRVAHVARGLDHVVAGTRPSRAGMVLSAIRAALPGAGRAALVNGVGAATNAGVTAATLTSLGPYAPVAGAAAGAAVKGLDRALPQMDAAIEGTPTADDVRRVLNTRLRPDEIGRQMANLQLLAQFQATSGAPISLVELMGVSELDGVPQALIRWVDRALAAIFLAWEKSDGHLGLLEPRLRRVADSLASIRAGLADVSPNLNQLVICGETVADDLHHVYQLLGGH